MPVHAERRVRVGYRRAVLALASIALAAGLPAATAYPRPATVERVSLANNGQQENDGPPEWDAPSITADGRYVAFVSKATNLVAGDTNKAPDVFVRDRVKHTTVRVSVASNGAQGIPTAAACGIPTGSDQVFGRGAWSPDISANGRFVAFTSCFTNIVAGDNSVRSDVFVHDMKMHTTVRVSVTSTGVQANGGSDQPTINDAGTMVAFSSGATNLDPAVCDSDLEDQVLCASPVGLATEGQVFVHDMRSGKTRLVSASSAGGLGNGVSFSPSISADGRFVAFTSSSDNLVGNDKNRCPDEALGIYDFPSCPDVYLRDLVKRSTQLVSVGLDGQAATSFDGAANGESGVLFVRQMITADDRFVAFRSSESNLIPNSQNSFGIYLWERLTGRIRRASVDSAGQIINTGQDFSALSRDGRTVALDGDRIACPGSSNAGAPGIDLHDMTTGATVQPISAAAACHSVDPQTVAEAMAPAIASDSHEMAFWSTFTGLVADDTNKQFDVFTTGYGSSLGVGHLVTSGRLAVAGDMNFHRAGAVSRTDPAGDVSAALSRQGLDLTAAHLTYRSASADLFARLELAQMPTFAQADPAALYGLDLTVGKTSYQVRIGKTGPTATFALFRQTAAGWTWVRDLAGGYGTTGQEVVAAIPLSALGAAHGVQLSSLRAFTGVGTVATGLLDQVDTASM
jgi:Tol biopolymer transport system component